MSIKYFYYISKTKIDIIEAQVQATPFALSEISPKVEIAGVSMGMDLKSQQNDNLIKRTLSLLNAMEKKRLVRPIVDVTDLDNLAFYHDEAVWFSGMFSFKRSDMFSHDYKDATLLDCYLLWRIWGDSIIFLAGSAQNVLGNLAIDGGIVLPQTLTLLDSFFRFVEQLTRIEETGETPQYTMEHSRHPGGLRFANFCVEYLSELPQRRLDTVFWLLEKSDFDHRADLPRWFANTIKKLPHKQQAHLERCRRVYVGTPLYTSLL
jgi:hypothetical protein